MEFYKVLRKTNNGKLRSSLRINPHSIVYQKITHAPEGTVLFVFSDIEAARGFSTKAHVIYRVKVTNPRVPTAIISSLYLDEIGRQDIRDFWKGELKNSFNESVIQPPMDFTYVCDSVELLEEVT